MSFHLSALTAGLLLAAGTGVGPLESLMWERRVLIVITPALDDVRTEKTLNRISAHLCEVSDRELSIVLATAKGEGHIDNRALSVAEVESIRWRFGADTGDFAVVLVGKDGGEKLRLKSPPELDQVFALIDTMPMRRAEMDARVSTCGN